MKRGTLRPSPSMVVGLLALFVALSGTGYAATELGLPARNIAAEQTQPRRSIVQGVRVVDGRVKVRNDSGPLQVAGNVKIHSDGRPLPVSGTVGVAGPVTVGGAVGINGPVTVTGTVGVNGPVPTDLPPVHLLASGGCNDNGRPQVVHVPNTSGLRITSIYLTTDSGNGVADTLDITPPGTNTPMATLQIAYSAYYDETERSMEFGAGLVDSQSGDWVFSCGWGGGGGAGRWIVVGR